MDIERATLQLDALLHELGSHSAHERDGRVALTCPRGPAIGIGEVDGAFSMPVGTHANAATGIHICIADDTPVDGRGDDTAALMILVVSCDFGSTGNAYATVVDESRRLMVLG